MTRTALPRHVDGTDGLAREILSALDERRQITPLSERTVGFDLPGAYRVAAAVRRLREARGERAVGRKIGFTNRTIWDEYGVHAPIWGPMYDATVGDLGEPFDLSRVVEPRIEPEIAFGFERAPEAGMSEGEILACVAWVAHGFEVVQSLFPGWRFRAPDTVAAFGLHGGLRLGPRRRIDPADRERWAAELKGFEITLLKDGAEADRGRAENVLGGGPPAALRHLVEAIAADPDAPPLEAGEIVTTGTLTKALPIAAGETWSTRIEGLPLEGITLSFARGRG